jgi:hypothetical protein
MPSDEMIQELYKLDGDGHTEMVAEHIRALVLRHHIPNISGFKVNRGEVISTISRKALPVEKVDSNVAHLNGGQKITLDEKFKARTDRAGKIAVFHIDGNLINLKELKEAEGNEKKSVRGGAEYQSDRTQLFLTVLETYCKTQNTRDPALEVLVSLMKYLTKSEQGDILETVKSLLSNDTLTTLAIVLQPYKSSNHYIPDQIFTAWAAEYSTDKTVLYSYIRNPVKFYIDAMNDASSKYSHAISNLKKMQASVDRNSIAKDNINAAFKEIYNAVASLDLPSARKSVASNFPEAVAEAELRVMGYLLHDQALGVDYNEALITFKNCSLNKPFICGESAAIKNMTTGVFYSSAFLIIRCEALFYLPGYGNGWADINSNIQLTNMLSIDVSLPLRVDLDAFYNGQIEKLINQLEKYQ